MQYKTRRPKKGIYEKEKRNVEESLSAVFLSQWPQLSIFIYDNPASDRHSRCMSKEVGSVRQAI